MPGKVLSLSLAGIAILFSACDFNLLPTRIPILSNVNGAASPQGPVGSTVVLQGAGFGDAQGSGQVIFTPVGGGTPVLATIANPTDWIQAAIVTTVPATAPGTYIITVQSNGVTTGGVVFAVTSPVTFNPSAVSWTAGPNLPSGLSGPGVAYAEVASGRYVYVVGGAGAGGTPVATVNYAAVGATGSLGAWTSATALPTALLSPAAVAATIRNSAVPSGGFLYAIGGSTTAAGAPVTTVYRAPINNVDGSIGGWTTTGALPTALRSVGAAVAFGSMYVIGGANSSNAPVTTTYRSPIQTDGAVSWSAQTVLPAARARFGFGVAGIYLYALGGDGGTVGPNDATGTGAASQVYYARLNPSTRDIGAGWSTNTNALTLARSAHTAVLGFGNLLVTGGLYTGASTHASENSYAAINADGSVGTFTTASPGTSINSVCGCNLFNHGATGYFALNGSFHVVIVGGDNVNAPGTPRVETYTY